MATPTELTLKGNSLNNATVEVLGNVEGIRITEQTVNDAGDEINIKLTVDKGVDLGKYRLKVTTLYGSTNFEIQVVEPTRWSPSTSASSPRAPLTPRRSS